MTGNIRRWDNTLTTYSSLTFCVTNQKTYISLVWYGNMERKSTIDKLKPGFTIYNVPNSTIFSIIAVGHATSKKSIDNFKSMMTPIEDKTRTQSSNVSFNKISNDTKTYRQYHYMETLKSAPLLLNMQNMWNEAFWQEWIHKSTVTSNALNILLAALFGDTLLGVHNKGTSMKNSIFHVTLEQIKFRLKAMSHC